MSFRSTSCFPRSWRALALALLVCLPVTATGGGGNGGISILPDASGSAALCATHHVSDAWNQGVVLQLPSSDAVSTVALMLPDMAAPAAVFVSTTAVVFSGFEIKALFDTGVRNFSLEVLSGTRRYGIDFQLDADGSCSVRIR